MGDLSMDPRAPLGSRSPAWLRSLAAPAAVVGGGLALARFFEAWAQQQACAKLTSSLALYLTIPLCAALLNLATNKLAVWMIFHPLRCVR